MAVIAAGVCECEERRGQQHCVVLPQLKMIDLLSVASGSTYQHSSLRPLSVFQPPPPFSSGCFIVQLQLALTFIFKHDCSPQ